MYMYLIIYLSRDNEEILWTVFVKRLFLQVVCQLSKDCLLFVSIYKLHFFLFHAAGHRKRKSHCWPGGCCPPCGCQFMLVANHSRYFNSLLSTSSSLGIIWILYVTQGMNKFPEFSQHLRATKLAPKINSFKWSPGNCVNCSLHDFFFFGAACRQPA